MTAENYLLDKLDEVFGKYGDTSQMEGVQKAMIEFAKYHVEQALSEASKTNRIDLFVRPDRKGSKYKLVELGESYDILGTRQMWKVNKESIINAYPTENIK